MEWMTNDGGKRPLVCEERGGFAVLKKCKVIRIIAYVFLVVFPGLVFVLQGGGGRGSSKVIIYK